VADEKIWQNLFTVRECSTYLSKNIGLEPILGGDRVSPKVVAHIISGQK